AQRAGRELRVERHRADDLVGARVLIPGSARERGWRGAAHDRLVPGFKGRWKTRLRLLAGMATRSTRSSPCRPARSETSPRSRTPHCGSRARRLASKAALLGAV